MSKVLLSFAQHLTTCNILIIRIPENMQIQLLYLLILTVLRTFEHVLSDRSLVEMSDGDGPVLLDVTLKSSLKHIRYVYAAYVWCA